MVLVPFAVKRWRCCSYEYLDIGLGALNEFNLISDILELVLNTYSMNSFLN